MEIKSILNLAKQHPLQKIRMWCCFILLLTAGIKVNAQYVLLAADEQYKLYNYSVAIKLYKEAYQKKVTLHTIERLADCYRLIKDYPEAERLYATLTKTKGAKPEAFFYYGEALRNNSKFSEAKVQYQKYVDGNNTLGIKQKSIMIVSCDSASSWMQKPKSLTINNVKNVNSAYEDWGSSFYEGDLVFTSDRKNTKVEEDVKRKPFLKFDDGLKMPNKATYAWTGNNYLRLYIKKKTDSAILFPVNAGSEYHIGAATFTADNKEMFFTLTRIPETLIQKNGQPKTIKIEIYSSKKDQNGTWSAPIPFKHNNINLYSIGDPYISKDGKTLYFVADMPGGKGKTDLYVCYRDEAGMWGQAIPLEELNTEGAERTPFVDGEGNFYFSTDGRIGMGGLDIFKVSKTDNKWTEPKNMGYPLNSPQDDFAFMLKTGKEGYLSSDRVGGNGSDDIYSFVFNDVKPPEVQKPETLVVKNEIVKPVDPVKKDTYAAQYDLFKDIKLENIYYDLNKSNIRQDAAIELDKVVKILKENPNVWIEIGSHTDSRADDNYNMKLSQARADAAVNYMVSRGIDRFRIKAKGYGELKLLNDCSNGKPCTEAQHQLNRRTEIKILKH